MKGIAYPLVNRKICCDNLRESTVVKDREMSNEYPSEPYDLKLMNKILSMFSPWVARENLNNRCRITSRITSGIKKMLIRGPSTLFLWIPIIRTLKKLCNLSVYFIDDQLITVNNIDLFNLLDDIVLHHKDGQCLIILSNADRLINKSYLRTNCDMTKTLLIEFIDACNKGIKFVLTENFYTLGPLFPQQYVFNRRPLLKEDKKLIMIDTLKITTFFDGFHSDGKPYCYRGNFTGNLLKNDLNLSTFLYKIKWMDAEQLNDFVQCMHLNHFINNYNDIILPNRSKIDEKNDNIYTLFEKFDILEYYYTVCDVFDEF